MEYLTERIDELALLLHKEQCTDLCGRWDNTASRHKEYYREQAERIIQRLEPEIGIANVYTAVEVVLDEIT